MNKATIQKLTLIVNTSILMMVLGLMCFFHFCKATIMVYFSLPTILVYLIGFVLIAKDKLYAYVILVYSWLMLYMSLATVCLGYTYGFHLYSLSMIPIIYYTNYMAYKLKARMLRTGIFSAAIIICYLYCTVYVSLAGPIYQGSNRSSAVFWITNSMLVFSFLIFYTRILISTTIDSEEKLKTLSYIDKLTSLYNRHYMVDQLQQSDEADQTDVIAMIDLDDFKKVNDVYGHNAGDYVLMEVAKIMQDTCPQTVISRWGGEEFLILMRKPQDAYGLMESLRKKIKETAFIFEAQTIPVSVTIGLSAKNGFSSMDEWIQAADEKLYTGKKNGKNVVIFDPIENAK